jgi:hypothetical protein
MTRHLLPLLLALPRLTLGTAVLWWRAARRGERGGRREYIARLDLLV